MATAILELTIDDQGIPVRLTFEIHASGSPEDGWIIDEAIFTETAIAWLDGYLDQRPERRASLVDQLNHEWDRIHFHLT